MSDRKAELERKKEKLRQIREEKERRKREREQAETRNAALKTVTGQAASSTAHRDINQQLAEVGIAGVDAVLGSLSAVSSEIALASLADEKSRSTEQLGSALASDTNLEALSGGLSMGPPVRARPKLGLTNVYSTSINPKTQETYAKQTQTVESGTDTLQARRGGNRDYYTFAFDDPEELYEEDSLPGLGSGSPSSGRA
eukprot:TCALIF_05665-PA protein Name:"Protein of unknown function" AED:0.43 eAED:0.45 QI:0/-1/0/1/-1/1/1/0/198